MKIIKPQALGMLFRPMEYRKRFGLCVSGFLHVPFAQNAEKPNLWSEQSMWDFLSKDMQVPMIDEGISKLTSEFLVHGYAYPDKARPNAVAVRARLGGVEKTLLAFGDRYWDGNAPSTPANFERMPLSWSNAYGGPDFPANTAGKGREAIEGVRWLPNLELPDARIRTADQAVVPAGFAALDVMHPQRAAFRGTHDQAWVEEHSMGFPPDLSWKFFNLAPRDQWFDAPLRGDEPYALEHLHPTRPLIEGQLPGLKVRMYAQRTITHGGETGHKLREVAMRLSTVWFFPHAERMVLIFHGLAECAEDDASDITALIGAVETLNGTHRRSDEHYLAVMEKRSGFGPSQALQMLNDSDLVTPDIDTADPDTAARQNALKPDGVHADAQYMRAAVDVALARDQVRARGQDPDALGVVIKPREKQPTPAELPAYIEKLAKQIEDERWATLDSCLTQIETALAFSKEHKIDLAAVAHRGPPIMKAPVQLAQIEREMARVGKPFDRATIGPKLEIADLAAKRAYQQAAHMQMPAPRLQGEAAKAARAELQFLLDRGIRVIPAIDLTGADLSNMDLRHIDFSGAWMESVDFSGSNLSYSIFNDAVLAHALMRGTIAIRCKFFGANLGSALLEDTVFDQSDLGKAILSRARFLRTELREANLTHAQLLETRWERADLSGAKLASVFFNKLKLKGCSFAGAQLPTAQFLECELAGADFRGAMLESTCFMTCKGEAVQFGGAQMPGTVFAANSVFARSDFTDAQMKGANLGQCNFDGARFVRANLESANLMQSSLVGSDLRLAVATGAFLRKANLSQARLAGVNFKDAILYGADLRGADLRASNLFGADLTRVHLDTDSRIDGAEMERARIFPRRRATAEG